jgi:hypothetical protein
MAAFPRSHPVDTLFGNRFALVAKKSRNNRKRTD